MSERPVAGDDPRRRRSGGRPAVNGLQGAERRPRQPGGAQAGGVGGGPARLPAEPAGARVAPVGVTVDRRARSRISRTRCSCPSCAVPSTSRGERGYTVLIADGERSDDAQAIGARNGSSTRASTGCSSADRSTPTRVSLFVEHGVAMVPSESAPDRDATRRWERGEVAATRVMAERLLALGHRRFVFVGTPTPGSRTAKAQGYRRGRRRRAAEPRCVRRTSARSWWSR